MQGVHLKIVHTVLRHSLIKITFDTYELLMPGKTAGAVDSILKHSRVSTMCAILGHTAGYG